MRPVSHFPSRFPPLSRFTCSIIFSSFFEPSEYYSINKSPVRFRRHANMSVEVIRTISPSTNEVVITRNGASAADLELLPKVATEAFLEFRKTKLKDRQDIVRKFLAALDKHKDDLALELTTQMGRPIAYTAKEVTTAIKRAEYLLKISNEVLQDVEGEAEKGFKRFIRRAPVGPVLIIFAWNVSSTTILCQPLLHALFRALSLFQFSLVNSLLSQSILI